MRVSTTQKVAAALASAALVLLVGVLAFVTVDRLVDATARRERTSETITRLEAILSDLKDAETGQRGYLLTGDSVYLDPYRAARVEADSEIVALRRLAAGDSVRRRRLDSLAATVRSKFLDLDSTIAVYDAQGFAAAAAVVRTDRGKRVMDEARLLVATMEERERRQEVDETRTQHLAARRALWVIGLGSAIAFLLAIVVNRAIRADVIEQLHQRDAAEAARVRMTAVLDSLPDATCVFDQRWRFTYFNPPATALLGSLGKDPATLIGRTLWDALPMLRGTRFERETREAAAAGQVTEHQYRLPVGDRWFENRIVPTPHGVVTLTRDVTERRRAEAREKFLAGANAVLAAAPLDYVVALDAVVRYAVPFLADYATIDVLVNGDRGNGAHPRVVRVAAAHRDAAKERLLRDASERYPLDPATPRGAPEVLRRGEPQLVPAVAEEDLARLAADEQHLAVLRELSPRSAVAVPLIAPGVDHAGGSHPRVLGAMTLVMAESGRVMDEGSLDTATELATRAGALVERVTLFREAEESRAAAEAANRAKSDFLATMSHEIRTPINAVIGYTELLELGISGPLTEQQREQLERIRVSTRHLLGLVNEVLDLAKVESGRLHIEATAVAAANTADAAMALIRPAAAAKGIALADECERDGGAVYVGDENRVRQVLTNLLANAVKFTEPGGRVMVRCDATGAPADAPSLEAGRTYVVFRVRDTGVGIAPEQVEAIFQPFTQAEAGGHGPYTRERSGTGLGLTISRQLARLMGGEITVESVPGQGSTFSFWLPAAEQRPEAKAPDVREPAPRGAGSRGIAVVPAAGADEARRARREGLERIADGLLERVGTILDVWSERLALDPETPSGRGLTRAELEDHGATFLTDVALAIRVLALGGRDLDISDLLRDSSAILRVISEHHGAQRRRLGWTETAIEREMQILCSATLDAIRDLARPVDGDAADEVATVVTQLMARATRLSVNAYRMAAEAGRP